MNDYLQVSELYHHGVKGQKWGIRRYQNEDGTLTEEGKARYGIDATGRMSDRGRLLYDADRSRQEERVKERRNKILIGSVAAATAVTAGILWYRAKAKRKAIASKGGKAAARTRQMHKGETFLKGYFKGVVRPIKK